MSQKIQCVPSHGQSEIEAIDVGLRFAAGEVRAVTDEQAAVLLHSRDFVDAGSGTNPNFTCVFCRKTTYGDAFVFRGSVVSLVDDEDHRVCEDCFAAKADAAPPADAPVHAPADAPDHAHDEETA